MVDGWLLGVGIGWFLVLGFGLLRIGWLVVGVGVVVWVWWLVVGYWGFVVWLVIWDRWEWFWLCLWLVVGYNMVGWVLFGGSSWVVVGYSGLGLGCLVSGLLGWLAGLLGLGVGWLGSASSPVSQSGLVVVWCWSCLPVWVLLRPFFC